MANYSEEQLAAINSNHQRILLAACAGSGKSHTLLGRIDRLISQCGVMPGEILALTFTNAAAAEMLFRYKQRHPGKMFPMFTTFHGFCFKLIIDDLNVRRACGYTDVPQLIEDDLIKVISEEIIFKLGLKNRPAALLSDKKLKPADEYERKLFKKAFEKRLKDDQLITYQYMADAVLKLFREKHSSILCYLERYRYVFCDEFQDTDDTQFEFIQAFADSDIFLAGDVLQSIYAFRGAKPELMMRLIKDPEWQTLRLTKNFRSTQEVCDYANEIGKMYDDDAFTIQMEAVRNGSPVFSVHSESVWTDSRKICEQLSDCFGSTAILCRTNREAESVINILSEHKINFITHKKDEDFAKILMSSLDNDVFKATLLGAMTNYQMRQCTIAKLLHGDESLEWLLSFIAESGIIAGKLSNIVEKVGSVAYILQSEELPFTKCKRILDLFDSHAPIITFAQTNEEIVEYLISIFGSDESEVYVGTIHSVKGLEFDNVFVLNVNTPIFALKTNEMINLFYVACTRAKNYLKVFREDVPE